MTYIDRHTTATAGKRLIWQGFHQRASIGASNEAVDPNASFGVWSMLVEAPNSPIGIGESHPDPSKRILVRPLDMRVAGSRGRGVAGSRSFQPHCSPGCVLTATMAGILCGVSSMSPLGSAT